VPAGLYLGLTLIDGFSMKITDLRATPVNIPFVAPYRFSYGSMASVTKTV